MRRIGTIAFAASVASCATAEPGPAVGRVLPSARALPVPANAGAVTLAPPAAPDAAPVAEPSPPALPAVETDWCIEGVPALDGETCYFVPAGAARGLLIYLHGTVPPAPSSRQKTTFQTVVVRASARAGAAALMPRGERGLGPRSQADWWAWPSSGSAYDRHAKRMVASFLSKRRQLEALVGRPFARTWLAGSSSGAYFVAALALRGDIQMDGFGAMSVGPAARALGTLLEKAGWRVKVAEHPLGHGAKEIYLDEAFAFWSEPAP